MRWLSRCFNFTTQTEPSLCATSSPKPTGEQHAGCRTPTGKIACATW
jgi:hypothetical protein